MLFPEITVLFPETTVLFPEITVLFPEIQIKIKPKFWLLCCIPSSQQVSFAPLHLCTLIDYYIPGRDGLMSSNPDLFLPKEGVILNVSL